MRFLATLVFISLTSSFAAPVVIVKPIDDLIDSIFIKMKSKQFEIAIKDAGNIPTIANLEDRENDNFLLAKYYETPEPFKKSDLLLKLNLVSSLVKDCDIIMKKNEEKKYRVCTRFSTLGKTVIRLREYSVVDLSSLYKAYDARYLDYIKRTSLSAHQALLKKEKDDKIMRLDSGKKLCKHLDEVRTMGRLLEYEAKAGVDFGHPNRKVIGESKKVLDKHNDEVKNLIEVYNNHSVIPFSSRECYFIKNEN